MTKKGTHFETQAIRTQIERSAQKEHSSPIFPTSSFIFESAEEAEATFAREISGNIYSRYSNPNPDEFIRKLCQMESCEAGIATASGMAAMFMSMAAFLKQGDHLIASRSIFGSSHQIITQLFPRWGIEHSYVDIHDPEGWEKALQSNTKMVFVESPSNPALDLIDLEALGKFTQANGILLNVDNCFCTPYLQNPKDYGADIVTHSATKFIDGQGRVLGGAVLASEELIGEAMFLARHTGPAMSPFHAWLLSKSLETLAVRMERHCQNALALAQFLESCPQVSFVKYPFLASHPQYELAKKQMRLGGGLVSFELKGGSASARKLLNGLQMFSLTSNLGDSRSIATHPATTTHSKLSPEERAAVGISDGLIRCSVGLEHIEDIQADLAQALEKI